MTKRVRAFLSVVVIILICIAVVYRMGMLPGIDTQLTQPDSSLTGYYYLRLDETAQDAYRCVLSHIREHPERILVPNLTDEQLDKVFTAISYDNPSLLCPGTGCRLISVGFRCYFIPQYSMERSVCDARTAALEMAAQTLCAGIPEGADDYGKELYLHDELAQRCEYSEFGDNVSNAYGALVVNTASCEGYARAMQLLLSNAGIASHLITGTAVNDEGTADGHMWNRVMLSGEWYNLDPTWNDHKADTGARHAYFNVTDDMIALSHSDFNLPDEVCSAVSMNYHVVNNLYFNNANSSFKARYKALVRSACTSGADHLEVRFSDAAVLAEAQSVLIDGKYAGECLAAVRGYDAGGHLSYSYTVDNASNSFILYF